MKLALPIAVVAILAAVVPATAGAASSTGTGTVFLPNPVADLQNQSLTDQKDADYPALQAAYHDVTLTNLALPNCVHGPALRLEFGFYTGIACLVSFELRNPASRI